MVRRLAYFAVTSVVALVTWNACGDDKKFDPNKAVSLETAVAPGQVVVGERAAVVCTRLNGRGEPLPGGAFTIGVAPLDAAFVDGSEVFSHHAGPHKVTCSDGELGLVDATPADLVVVAGPPTTTTLTIAPTEIEAGENAEVLCQALDAHGNIAVANLRLDTTPAESVTADGVTGISATAVGDYTVVCFSAQVDEDKRATATFTVVPGPRAGIALRLEPDQRAYGIGGPIKVTAVGADRFGNELEGVEEVQNLAATPAGHHEVIAQGQKIRFDLEGRYTISAAAKSDATQTATADVVVDQTKPSLVLESPERGLVTETMQTVKLVGTVSDNLGALESVTVAGQKIDVPSSGGKFTVDVDLNYGITLLDVHAVDTQGLETLVTRAVEQGLGGFRAMATRTMETDGIDNAAAVVLAQAAFDDGEDEDARDDLAGILEYIVKNLDFSTIVPNPLTSFACISGTCTLALTSVTMDDVDVVMQLQHGRIHIDIILTKFAGQMTLDFPCDIPVVCTTRPRAQLPTTLASERVTLSTDMFVSVVDGVTTVSAENTVVDIAPLTVTITGDPTGVLQGALTGAITLIQDVLVAALEALIQTLVEDQLASALGGLFAALQLDRTFDLPSPVPDGPKNTIVIQTRPQGVDIAPERLQLRVGALAYALNPKRPHTHLGSLRRTGCEPETALQFPPPHPITVALHDDLINQLLFAIWEGGTLSLDLKDGAADGLLGQFGLLGATVKVDPLLPPVFESCRGDDVVQLGDLYVEIESEFAGEPLHLGLWLLAEAPIDIVIGPNAEGALAASVVIAAIDPLWIEVAINEGPFAEDEGAVVGLVKDALIPQLLKTVSDSANFTLPSIDLGALTTAVPAGTTIDLDVREIARDHAYLTVYGALK